MSELKWPSEEEVRKMFANKEGFGSDATLSAALELPEVRAMVDALEAFYDFDHLPYEAKRPDIFEIRVRRKLLAALAAIKEPKI